MEKVNIKGLPVYEATISGDNQGMMRVSLVDEPAVLTDFLKFKAQKPDDTETAPMQLNFAVADEEKRLVYGVLMRADFPIYRREEREGEEDLEYYIMYHADTLRLMAEKYLAESRQNNVNLDHGDDTDVEGVNMVQLFIKDSEKGVSPEGFDEVADGSLFAEYHVMNDDVWDAIKDGTYKGFSLEGLFNVIPEESQDYVDEAVSNTEKFSKDNNSKQKTKMGKMSKVKAAFAKMLVKMASVTTDKAILSWDGDEDLKAEDEVYILDENGEKVTPEDGDYTTEDGKVIVVVDGKVSEIKDAEAEVSEEGEAQTPAEEQKNARKAFFKAMKEKFEASYQEKENIVVSALGAVIEIPKDEQGHYLGDWYMAECAESYAIVAEYNYEDWIDHYHRYPLTWDGLNVTLGEPEEVKRIFAPMDYEVNWDGEKPTEEPAEKSTEESSSEEMAQMRSELDALKVELEKYKKEPSDVPAHQAYNKANAEPSAENKAARLASFRRRK